MATKSGLITVNDHWRPMVTETSWLPSNMWQLKHVVALSCQLYNPLVGT